MCVSINWMHFRFRLMVCKLTLKRTFAYWMYFSIEWKLCIKWIYPCVIFFSVWEREILYSLMEYCRICVSTTVLASATEVQQHEKGRKYSTHFIWVSICWPNTKSMGSLLVYAYLWLPEWTSQTNVLWVPYYLLYVL